MMNAYFGREMAQDQLQRRFDEAERDRLAGYLRRVRRETRRETRRHERQRAQAARRAPVATACAQDVG